MNQCKYCEAPAANLNICGDCQSIIQDHEDNVAAGMCTECNGSGTALDGTDCAVCGGIGFYEDQE